MPLSFLRAVQPWGVESVLDPAVPQAPNLNQRVQASPRTRTRKEHEQLTCRAVHRTLEHCSDPPTGMRPPPYRRFTAIYHSVRVTVSMRNVGAAHREIPLADLSHICPPLLSPARQFSGS